MTQPNNLLRRRPTDDEAAKLLQRAARGRWRIAKVKVAAARGFSDGLAGARHQVEHRGIEKGGFALAEFASHAASTSLARLVAALVPPAAKARSGGRLHRWWRKVTAWARPKPPPPAPPPSTAAVAAAAGASGLRRGLDLLQPLLPLAGAALLAGVARADAARARRECGAARALFALACAADALDACIHLLLALAFSGAVHVDHHDLHHAEHLALASAAVACAAAIGGELLGKEGDHGHHGDGHSKAH